MNSNHKPELNPFEIPNHDFTYTLVAAYLSAAEKARLAQANSFHYRRQMNYQNNNMSKVHMLNNMGLSLDSPKLQDMQDPELIYMILTRMQALLIRKKTCLTFPEWRFFSRGFSRLEKKRMEADIIINLNPSPTNFYGLKFKSNLDLINLRVLFEKWPKINNVETNMFDHCLYDDITRECYLRNFGEPLTEVSLALSQEDPALAKRILEHPMLKDKLISDQMKTSKHLSQVWHNQKNRLKTLLASLNPWSVLQETWERQKKYRIHSRDSIIRILIKLFSPSFWMILFFIFFPSVIPDMVVLIYLMFLPSINIISDQLTTKLELGNSRPAEIVVLFLNIISIVPNTISNFLNHVITLISMTALTPFILGGQALIDYFGIGQTKTIFDYAQETKKANSYSEKVKMKIFDRAERNLGPIKIASLQSCDHSGQSENKSHSVSRSAIPKLKETIASNPHSQFSSRQNNPGSLGEKNGDIEVSLSPKI